MGTAVQRGSSPSCVRMTMRAALVCALIAVSGCPGTGIPSGPVPGSITKEGPGASGSFARATPAVFDDNGAVRLEGQISLPGEMDVFNIGARVRGDRIIVDAKTPNSLLDVSIAVFDAQGRLVVENDDRGGSGSNFLDSYISFVVRHDGNPYFLVVTHSAFAASNRLLGDYLVDVFTSPGHAVPEPRPQTLYLDFSGGLVDSPVLGTFQLEPFDAGDIDDVYAGQTQLMKNTIRDVFLQNFERFNVTIVTSDEAIPAAPFSIVYFGGFNRTAFGLAENVDLYNIDMCDDAIVFTQSFSPDIFVGTPSAQQVAVAMGNVGSHEAGHLLGLNHTDDDDDLMDDRSLANVLFTDQEFMEAPLSGDIMPIGTQDGVLLLSQIVGLVESLTISAERRFVQGAPSRAGLKRLEAVYDADGTGRRMLTREMMKK